MGRNVSNGFPTCATLELNRCLHCAFLGKIRNPKWASPPENMGNHVSKPTMGVRAAEIKAKMHKTHGSELKLHFQNLQKNRRPQSATEKLRDRDVA